MISPAAGDRIHWTWTTGDSGLLSHESCFLSESLFSDLSTYELHVSEQPLPQSDEITEMDFELAACDLRDGFVGDEDPQTVLPGPIVRALRTHSVPKDQWFNSLFSADLRQAIEDEQAHLVYAELETNTTAIFDTAERFYEDELETLEQNEELSESTLDIEYTGVLYTYAYSGMRVRDGSIIERRAPINLVWRDEYTDEISDMVGIRLKSNEWQSTAAGATRFILVPIYRPGSNFQTGIRGSEQVMQLAKPITNATQRWNLQLYEVVGNEQTDDVWIGQACRAPRMSGITSEEIDWKYAESRQRLKNLWADGRYQITDVDVENDDGFPSSDGTLTLIEGQSPREFGRR